MRDNFLSGGLTNSGLARLSEWQQPPSNFRTKSRCESHLCSRSTAGGVTASRGAMSALFWRPLHTCDDVRHRLLKTPDPPRAEKKTRRGNYAEETDRRASISVQVSERALIKGRCVRCCLMAGWAWRQTAACRATCPSSDCMAAWEPVLCSRSL